MGENARRSYGEGGEEAAVRFLRAAGFQIHARNFQCRYGELDVVAEKDGTLCFVEVRMRSHAAWGDPSQTVTFAKQRKVVRAALQYLFERRISKRAIRFDVVAVVGRGGDAQVEHLPGAFDAGM